MGHAFIVDEERWKEAQKESMEFWGSEEGQRLREEIHRNARSFEELIKRGKTKVKVVTNKEDKIK